MYADRVVSGTKRSIKERLDGDVDESLDRPRQAVLKRQRQADERWKHDLYEGGRESLSSNPNVGPKDLRLKLQKKVPQQTYQHRKETGVQDLREKLSGIMHSHAKNTDPPKAKSAPESSIPVKKSVASVEASTREIKKVSNPTSGKKAKQKSELSLEGFLQSLGLEKYLITFQIEEVDMATLMHMTEDDLKALSIPMGPRKKILLQLESRS